MSQGVPGIPPAKSVQAALAEASSSPSSFGYCPNDGEPTLRKALADEMNAIYESGGDISSADIALTAGCNMAFIAAVMALADAGEEVILPVPWYARCMIPLINLSDSFQVLQSSVSSACPTNYIQRPTLA